MLKIPYIETILYICKQKEITTPKWNYKTNRNEYFEDIYNYLFFNTIFSHIFCRGKIECQHWNRGFDSIPSEIDGGCCVFYKYPNKMRNKSYIMVNDLATTAYMMINRHLEEFTLVSNQKDIFWYKNKRFTLKVTINHTQSKGDNECYKVKGILIVEDRNKNQRKLSFCGNCSW